MADPVGLHQVSYGFAAQIWGCNKWAALYDHFYRAAEPQTAQKTPSDISIGNRTNQGAIRIHYQHNLQRCLIEIANSILQDGVSGEQSLLPDRLLMFEIELRFQNQD
jgi:hypothetical protein